MIKHITTGLGAGLLAVMLVHIGESLVGAQLDRNGMTLIVLLAGAVGSAIPQRSCTDELTDDQINVMRKIADEERASWKTKLS